jgi:hypothetical protein
MDSTHNCIDIVVAKQLNLFVYPTKDLTVMVTDGQKVKEVGRCHKGGLQLIKKEQETQSNRQQQKQVKYINRKHKGFTLNNQVKRL